MKRLTTRSRHMICAAMVCLNATACSNAPDAASEVPVDLSPGQYTVTFSTGGLLKSGSGEKSHLLCFRKGDGALFAHRLVQNYYALHASCSGNPAPREGNAVGGEIRCSADPKLADGANRFIYSGAVAQNRVKVEVRIKFEAMINEGSPGSADTAQLRLAMQAIEHARFIIEARRTGDCR